MVDVQQIRCEVGNSPKVGNFASPYRGVEQLVARWAHNPKVVSSSLTPATKEKTTARWFFYALLCLRSLFREIR